MPCAATHLARPSFPDIARVSPAVAPGGCAAAPAAAERRAVYSQGYTSMTEPNAPASGATPGSPRAERGERAPRALQSLARELMKTAIVVRGLQEAPRNLFPPPAELTSAQHAELWGAGIALLMEDYMRLHQTAKQAIGAASDLLGQR